MKDGGRVRGFISYYHNLPFGKMSPAAGHFDLRYFASTSSCTLLTSTIFSITDFEESNEAILQAISTIVLLILSYGAGDSTRHVLTYRIISCFPIVNCCILTSGSTICSCIVELHKTTYPFIGPCDVIDIPS